MQGDNWNDLLKEVVTFDSVEEFWGVYVSITSLSPPNQIRRTNPCPRLQNNITPTSELAIKSDYHLFKSGVRPEWEDQQNKHGGKWSYSFYKKDKPHVPIDDLWLHTMLAAIGETLENEGDNEVMGVVVNVRKGFYRIGLWTKTMGKGVQGKGRGGVSEENKNVLLGIGTRFKEVLTLEGGETVEFSGHADAANQGSTRAKARFVV